MIKKQIKFPKMKKWNEFCLNNRCSVYEGKTERACSGVPSL